MLHRPTTLIAVLLAIAAAGQLFPATTLHAESPVADLYSRAKAATALIMVDDRCGGMAWWIDDKGTAITAAHIVGGPGRRIEMQFSTLDRVAAKVVAIDRGSDTAVLACEPRQEPYPHLNLAEKTPPPGEDVYLFGAPLFREDVLLRGMVARDDVYYEFYGGEKWYVGVIHISASVMPVTSGGVWLNARGEAVGLQSGSLMMNNVPSCLAHMIPVERIKSLAASRQHAQTPTLGIGVEELWQQPPQFLQPLPPRARGLVIKQIQNASPLRAAEVKEGEIIVAVDDQPVARVAEYVNYVRGKKPAEKVTLTLLGREGAENRKVEVELDALEADWLQVGK